MLTAATTGVLDAYMCSLDWLEPRVAAVGPGHLRLPTPCSEWDVEALLDHVLSTMTSYASLGERASLDRAPTRPHVRDGQLLNTFQTVGAQGRSVWARDGVLERDCEFPYLGRAPGSVVLGVHVSDLVVHGWDLARATGQDDRIDDACVDFVQRFSEEVFVAERREPYFRKPWGAPANGDKQAVLIAYSGRDPEWKAVVFP